MESAERQRLGDMLPKIAPYVGAWIETVCAFSSSTMSIIAPYVGAWIETVNGREVKIEVTSRPTWARGLKLRVFWLF